MAEKMMDLGQGLEIWKVPLSELLEQDVNARSMPKQMFERLTATVGRDKRLESLPLCAKTTKGIEIVSGHHRTRGARAAGLEEIFCIVDVTGLTPDKIKAKQLAHNAISGEDNMQLLAKIYQQIGDVDSRVESFIDPAKLNIKVEKVAIGNIDLGLEYKTVLMTFLPYELEKFDAVLEKVRPFLTDELGRIYMAELKLLDRWKAALRRAGKEYDVRAVGTIVGKIADLALDALGEETESEEMVPLRDIFGASSIPAEAAAQVKSYVDRLVAEGTLEKKNRWKALPHLIQMVTAIHGNLG